jgi:hypothetical protein
MDFRATIGFIIHLSTPESGKIEKLQDSQTVRSSHDNHLPTKAAGVLSISFLPPTPSPSSATN